MTHFEITYGTADSSFGHGTLIARSDISREGLARKCRREFGEPLHSLDNQWDHAGCNCGRTPTPRDARLAMGQAE
jgi:hypothetical protein